MNTFKIQLQNIFNRQTATDIYHHFSLIWSVTFKVVTPIDLFSI
ncbi:hypothetical protein PDPJ_3_00096 [Photobacterium damselae subsp. piscicida]|nr:hypothetical protein PDPJ_3_00096 [Photobacterium damselae subsp. piscicida]